MRAALSTATTSTKNYYSVNFHKELSSLLSLPIWKWVAVQQENLFLSILDLNHQPAVCLSVFNYTLSHGLITYNSKLLGFSLMSIIWLYSIKSVFVLVSAQTNCVFPLCGLVDCFFVSCTCCTCFYNHIAGHLHMMLRLIYCVELLIRSPVWRWCQLVGTYN